MCMVKSIHQQGLYSTLTPLIPIVSALSALRSAAGKLGIVFEMVARSDVRTRLNMVPQRSPHRLFKGGAVIIEISTNNVGLSPKSWVYDTIYIYIYIMYNHFWSINNYGVVQNLKVTPTLWPFEWGKWWSTMKFGTNPPKKPTGVQWSMLSCILYIGITRLNSCPKARCLKKVAKRGMPSSSQFQAPQGPQQNVQYINI